MFLAVAVMTLTSSSGRHHYDRRQLTTWRCQHARDDNKRRFHDVFELLRCDRCSSCSPPRRASRSRKLRHHASDDPARISVTAVAGDVAVTMAGTATDVRTDSTVNLPARIVTGGDGMLGLTQAGTNITVARDTDVEIPAEAVDGNLVARLVQHRGNVFYDVAHRDVGKLRVETPYLVAVIKGTQFNVAVQQDSTTISLFEGRLEIRTPDGSETIQLNAGEIAIRSSTDGAIRVLGMNDQRVAAPRAAGPALGSAAATVRPDQTPAATARVGGVAGNASAGTTTLAANLDLAPSVADQKNDGGGSERPTVHIASGLDLAVDGNAGLDAQASVDLGIASAGLGVAVDSSGVDAALSAKVDLGARTWPSASTPASTWRCSAPTPA